MMQSGQFLHGAHFYRSAGASTWCAGIPESWAIKFFPCAVAGDTRETLTLENHLILLIIWK